MRLKRLGCVEVAGTLARSRASPGDSMRGILVATTNKPGRFLRPGPSWRRMSSFDPVRARSNFGINTRARARPDQSA